MQTPGYSEELDRNDTEKAASGVLHYCYPLLPHWVEVIVDVKGLEGSDGPGNVGLACKVSFVGHGEAMHVSEDNIVVDP